MLLFLLVFGCLFLPSESSIYYDGEEVLLNSDFEAPLDGSDWQCSACELQHYSADAHEGSYCGRVSNRSANWAGVTQYVDVAQHTNYYFSAHVKLLNQQQMWTKVELFAEVKYHASAGGNTEYVLIGELPHVTLEQGWHKLGGDFYINDKPASYVRLYIQVDDPSSEYLVDTASLRAFYLNANWRHVANERIDVIRKNNITIDLRLPSSMEPADVIVQINQTTHGFPFCSAIVNYVIGGDSEYDHRYQDCFYSHFNWAVSEGAMKWHVMEPQQYEIAFPDESVRKLAENGVPLRGHCVFWGKEEFVPTWLLNMTSEEIMTELSRRIEYLVPHYVGQVAHWDVNNERLHGIWFEEQTGDAYLLDTMFRDVRAHDPNATLFLNDYNVISSSRMTQALTHQYELLTARGAPVDAIGIQSHLDGYPDTTVIAKRLDVIRSSGARLWITELDVPAADEYERADGYDDVVTLFFSDPDIDGILLWGFSDQHHWKPSAALFEGEYFQANAAGRRWQQMLGERWHTYVEYSPGSVTHVFETRGFHGKYQIKVLFGGDVIFSDEHTLSLTDQLDIVIDLSTS